MLFIIGRPPEPEENDITEQSLRYMQEKCRVSDNELAAAQAELDRQIEKYDAGADWRNSFDLSRKEELVDKAKAEHLGNMLKFYWETQKLWDKKIPINPKAAVTPWKHDPKNWSRCFSGRGIKPKQ